MKKIIFFFLFLPLFYLSQNTLVKWYNKDFAPTYVESQNVFTAYNVTAVANEFSNHNDNEGSNYFLYKGNYSNVLNESQYVQFKIEPKAGYKLTINKFNFTAQNQGNSSTLVVKGSTDGFATAANTTTLIENASMTSSYTTYSALLGSVVIPSGTSYTIRIYDFNTYNAMMIRHDRSGAAAYNPSFEGTASLITETVPTALDDNAISLKNANVNINVLNNDKYKYSCNGILTGMNITTPPQYGTAVIQSNKTITYTHANNYTGADNFQYTITNCKGVSNPASVRIQVLDAVDAVASWNKTNKSPTFYSVPPVTGTLLEGVGLTISSNNPYQISGAANPQNGGVLDPEKYAKFSISAPTDYSAFLTSFSMGYSSTGSGNFTIKYSTTENFSSQVYTLVDGEPFPNSQISKTWSLGSGVSLSPGQSLYFRIFPYNTYQQFYLNYTTGTKGTGPTLNGVVLCQPGNISPNSATVCSGTGTTLTFNGNSSSFKWQSSSDNSNFTDIVGAANVTYNTGNLTSTTYFRVVITSGSCSGNTTMPVKITVKPNPTFGTVTATPAAACGNGTSTITATGLISNSTGTYYYTTSATGATENAVTVTADARGNATFTTPILPTSYDGVSITITKATVNGCTTIFSGKTVTLQVGRTTTYTGTGVTGWDNGVPRIIDKAVIAENYSAAQDITACALTVNARKVLTIGAGKSATIQNSIINNGNIIVESEGNLIQKNDAGTYTGTGSFQVLRNSNMKRLDYTYWSAPVKDQQLKAFSPSTVATRFLEYHEGDDYFYSVNWLTNFEIAKGYAIRAPNNFPATYNPTNPANVFKGSFIGQPNNGLQTFNLAFQSGPGLPGGPGNGYNLIGNPYPSNIDFETLLTVKDSGGIENNTKIYGTAYFWTNNDPNPPVEQQGSGYLGNNYAIYNGTGGIAAASSTGGGAVTPTQFIKVGQGFIIKAKPGQNGKELVFNNSVRDHIGAGTFFNRGMSSDKDRYWLTLTSPALNVNTLLIGYVINATNDLELDYDAPLMTVGSDSFYTVLDNNKLGIQGRQYPLNPSDVVPLGANHYESGNYTISLAEREGIFANGQNIYLKDKQTGTVTNLSEGSYTFFANKGVSEGRFEIIYQPETVLATGSDVKEELVIYRDGNDFILKAQSKKITAVEVFDTSGRLIYVLNPNSNYATVPADQLTNGLYILKINQNGKITTRKILK